MGVSRLPKTVIRCYHIYYLAANVSPKNESTTDSIASTNRSLYWVRWKLSMSLQLLAQVGNWLAHWSVCCCQISYLMLLLLQCVQAWCVRERDKMKTVSEVRNGQQL